MCLITGYCGTSSQCLNWHALLVALVSKLAFPFISTKKTDVVARMKRWCSQQKQACMKITGAISIWQKLVSNLSWKQVLVTYAFFSILEKWTVGFVISSPCFWWRVVGYSNLPLRKPAIEFSSIVGITPRHCKGMGQLRGYNIIFKNLLMCF